MAMEESDIELERMLQKIDADPTLIDDLQDSDVAKKLYKLLRQEQQRSEVYQLNLTKKMQRLKADLDERTEKVEQIQRNLLSEERKYADANFTSQRERQYRAQTQEEKIRGHLAEALFSKAASTEDSFELDTVVISYVRLGDGMRYNLTFRVDYSTTVQDLRLCACRYWGIKSEDYILKTLANNKCQDGLHVQECFKQGEIAQLRLEARRTTPSQKPTDDELKAIVPIKQKSGRARRHQEKGYNAAGVNKLQQQHDSHASELKRMGGTYFLLRTRAGKPSEHVAKIKLRDVIFYLVLLALSMWSYSTRRPVGRDYWLIRGFSEQLQRPLYRPDGVTPATSLNDIATAEDAVSWIGYTLPRVVMSTVNSTNLASKNMLLGYLSIRTKHIKTPSSATEYCEDGKEMVENLASEGAACHPYFVNSDNEATSSFTDLKTYWDAKTQAEASLDPLSRLRGPTNPYDWASAEHNEKEHHVSSFGGRTQTFDASGYSAEFNLQVSGRIADYEADIAAFTTAGWFAETCRLIVASFTAYNFDLDMWVAAELAFELSPSGAPTTSVELKPFRPRISETRVEQTHAYSDYARLVIAFYIAVFVGNAERNHKIKDYKAGCLYYTSLNGICDVGIVACILVVVIWRAVGFTTGTTKDYMEEVADVYGTQGFTSMMGTARAYCQIFSVEGLLMLLICNRLISFCRLNSTVYTLWHTLGKATLPFFYFVLMFLPTFTGCVLITNRMYGAYLEEYSTVPGALLQLYQLLEGELDVQRLLKLDVAWTIVVLLLFYIAIRFLLLNAFVAIVVDSYYAVKLTSTRAEKWNGLARWVLPSMVWNGIQSLKPASQDASTSAA
eukprot:CAMPEP_0206576128 /NCGR_PEP_ID=MMETSP0325_2-20121206/30551_1 /ASSEMBLY_ACC=CAM_ASM_000347 /TAXON_ID=2866 /ORGANISM="Crypthecodinium cohnii, Strain Seligo" /LENGTH=841 /DNA_ID=CAMNT_0054081253 /DNA_START=32 /DNA_END=2557 /DNA_ORIENTATION=+